MDIHLDSYSNGWSNAFLAITCARSCWVALNSVGNAFLMLLYMFGHTLIHIRIDGFNENLLKPEIDGIKVMRTY